MSVQELQAQRTVRIGARTAVRVGLGFGAALVLWMSSYAVGLFPWLGYAAVDRSSIGVGPDHFIVGENKTGAFSFGPQTFVFVDGQTIVVSYDADIRRGCLWMHVWNISGRANKEDHVSQCVTASGRGEWTVPIKETGLYRIFIDGSPIKGNRSGWDMTYSVWWGARW